MKYKIIFEENTWIAKEIHEEGLTLNGYGDTPENALKDIKSSHDSLNKALNYTEPQTPKDKIRETFKRQINTFIDELGQDDICQLNICTEVLARMTPSGVEKKQGDKYLAVVVKKSCGDKENYTLQEIMDYPAKKVFEFFQTVK